MNTKDTIATSILYGFLFGLLLAVVLWGFSEPKEPGETTAQHTTLVYRQSLDGRKWAVYRMGKSIHMIRQDTIAAILYTDKGIRNEVYFAGGTFQNSLTLGEIEEAMKLDEQYKAEHNGESAPLTINDFVFLTK